MSVNTQLYLDYRVNVSKKRQVST